jgi:hypothetical protein
MAEMKMVTVDQYMEENQLNEMEVRHQLFNGKIKLFAWVSNLPMIHFWPIARYKIKNPNPVRLLTNTDYVDLFRPRRYGFSYRRQDSAHGLIGLSKEIVLTILGNGSIELPENSLNGDVTITKHTVFIEGKCRLDGELTKSIRGSLPDDIKPASFERRAGRLANYPSDLFEDNRLKTVVADIMPDFDFRAWRNDDAYREENFEHVKSTFETVIDEHKFKPKSFLDQRAYVPVIFEKDKLLSEITSLPDGAYRIEAEDFNARKLSRHGVTFKPNQFRLEVKVPPPVISRSQLIVFDINEDMYSLGGEVEDIVLQDELEPEELENELDYQSDLYTNEKRLLVLKGWLGASKYDVSKPLTKTRQQLWDELSKTDREIFPPMSESTIKDFFKSQDICNFKIGRPAGGKKTPI